VTNCSGTKAYFFRSLRTQFQSGVLVALGLNQHIENLDVDCAPQIRHPPIDLQIDFVKVPSRGRLRAARAQLRCNHRSEMIHPTAHGFVGDRDPALGQQILDVAKAEGEPEIKPDRVVNDLSREPISRVADLPHTPWVSRLPKSKLMAA
jgi:hypothetical protein